MARESKTNDGAIGNKSIRACLMYVGKPKPKVTPSPNQVKLSQQQQAENPK